METMSLTVTILANGNCTSCCQQETNSVLSRDTSHLLHGAALFQKLTGSQLVKKFPVFYRTRRFSTALTRARHPSLSWASSVQSMTHIPLPKGQS